MSAPPVTVALLGCGTIASAVHLRALARMRGVEVVAVADPDPQALARARGIVAGAELTADAAEAIGRRDVDAVVVTAPNGLHAELGLAAIASGKHLYLEKPIATAVADGARLVEAAGEAGVVAAAGFNRRFHPLYRQALRELASGRLGVPRCATTAFCEPLEGVALPEWKRARASGGGVLLDLGSHHFDLLRWLLGRELEHVAATLRSGRSEDDGASLVVGLADGVEALTTLSFVAGRADSVEVFCERGALRLDRYAGSLSLRVARRSSHSMGRRRVVPSAGLVGWRLLRVVRPASEPSYAGALRAFVARLRGAPVELPSLADGLRSLEAVEAAERSAARGGTRVRVGG